MFVDSRPLSVEYIAQLIPSNIEATSIDLADDLALQAARISLDYQMPMADSIILATARAHEAVLWTQDQDFKGMENVNCFRRQTQ